MPQLPPVAAAAFVLCLLAAVAITTVIVQMRSRRRRLLLAAMVRESAPIPRPTVSTAEPIESELLPLRGRNYQRAEREGRFQPFDDRPTTREGAPGRPGRRLAAQVAYAAPVVAPSPPLPEALVEDVLGVFPPPEPEDVLREVVSHEAPVPAAGAASPVSVVEPLSTGPAGLGETPAPTEAPATLADDVEAVGAAETTSPGTPHSGVSGPATPPETPFFSHAGLGSVDAFDDVSRGDGLARAGAHEVGVALASTAGTADANARHALPMDEADPPEASESSLAVGPRPSVAPEVLDAAAAPDTPAEQEAGSTSTQPRSNVARVRDRRTPEVVVLAPRTSLPVPALSPLLTREVSLGDAARVLRGLTMTDGRQLRRAVAVGAATSVVAAAFAIRGRRRG